MIIRPAVAMLTMAYPMIAEARPAQSLVVPITNRSRASSTLTSAYVADDQGEGMGSIAGRVVDERRSPLAGALVRIEQAGRTAATDQHGVFRFRRIPAGQHNLSVFFLGFEPVIRAITIEEGHTSTAEVTVKQPLSEGEPIIVYGTRSARARALNVERTAENSADVISADDLGHFTGTTLSDALRRLPGVSFQRDPLTGDGTNIIVRGLEPDMNAVKLNGLNLPVGNGTGRSADLSNLLADTVGRITVNKTLLPHQDSSGTGGLVEIETLSPLDRPRRYAKLQLEAGRRGAHFGNDRLMSGVISGRFGREENFGISVAVQYRKNSARNVSYNTGLNYGRALPLDSQGLPTLLSLEAISPLLTFPFSPAAAQAYPNRIEIGFNDVRQSTLAAALSLGWQIGASTTLRFDALHSETKRSTLTLTDAFSASLHYADRPGAPALNELQLDLTPGNQALRREQVYLYDPHTRVRTNTFSFNGRSALGSLTFNSLLGYARGTERHPRALGLLLQMPASDARLEYFLPQAVDRDAGLIISPFGPRAGRDVPLPLFSEAGWALVNDPSKFLVRNGSGEVDRRHGDNDRYTGSVSARYDFDRGPLSYLEAGAWAERTKFKSGRLRAQLGGNVPVTALGLEFSPSDLNRIGVDVPGFTVISSQSLAHFADTIGELTSTGLTLTKIVPQPGQDKEGTREDTLAGYFQSRFLVGKFEIIGGARVTRTKLQSTNLMFPTYIGPILPENGGGFGNDFVFRNAFTKLVSQKATATDLLPRILFNYRSHDNLIVRGGYFLSVARPEIAQLSRETQITFINIPIPGPAGVKPVLQISAGNPNLKPAITHNFDLSVEHYSGRIGVMRLSGFYKRIRNLLQTNITNGPVNLANVVLPDSPYFQGSPFFDRDNPEAYFIMGQTPANSRHPSSIWGIEAQIERRFTALPGLWSGFGIYANYTFTKSSRTTEYSWAAAPNGAKLFAFRSIPFQQQPRQSGTVALTYANYGLDANLTYGFQSRALGRFEPRGLSVYAEGVRTLDFRAEYNVPNSIARFARIRVFFEGSDLLKGNSSPDVLETFGGAGPTPRFYSRGTYLGGRRFSAGLSATF